MWLQRLLVGFVSVWVTCALAAPETIVLSIPRMDCAPDVIVIKKVLQRQAGVQSVKVDLKTKQAIVTYDSASSAADTLTRATEQAGFPSTLRQAPTAPKQ